MAPHFIPFSHIRKPPVLRLFAYIISSLSAVHAFSVTINSPSSTASAPSQTSSQSTPSGSNTSIVGITVGDAIGGVVFLVLLITLGIRCKRKAAYSSDITSSPERQPYRLQCKDNSRQVVHDGQGFTSRQQPETGRVSHPPPMQPGSRSRLVDASEPCFMDGQTVSPDTFPYQNLPVGLAPPVHPGAHSHLTDVSSGNPAVNGTPFIQIQPSRPSSDIDDFAIHANARSSCMSTASEQIAAIPEVASTNNPFTYQTEPIYLASPNQPGTLSHPTSTYNTAVGGRDLPLNLSQVSPLISNVDGTMHVNVGSPSMSSSVGRETATTSQTAISTSTQLITPTDIEDDEPLCSTCSALDLRTMLREGIREEHSVALGYLTDVFSRHDQCGLCRLIATHIRRMWQLDKQPGINIDGRPCSLYVEASGSLFGASGDLNGTSSKDICHHLYIKTSTGPRGMYISATMPQSPLTRTLEIRLLEEDASKVGRMKQFHGRRVGQTVDVGLLKNWIHDCENKHGDRCEMVW
jgi:hypothetical protein